MRMDIYSLTHRLLAHNNSCHSELTSCDVHHTICTINAIKFDSDMYIRPTNNCSLFLTTVNMEEVGQNPGSSCINRHDLMDWRKFSAKCVNSSRDRCKPPDSITCIVPHRHFFYTVIISIESISVWITLPLI